LAKADQKLRFAVLFPKLAAQHAERVTSREAVDVVYAYEVHGALAARLLKHSPGVPTVARFQGTVMYPALNSPLLRLRRYEEVLALRLPADLYIMTDDGTRGDDVLTRTNPAALPKLRFWRNGLDLPSLQPSGEEERRQLRQAFGLREDAFVLLTTSRLAAWKRVDRAIEALPAIVREVPNVMLVVVGDGEERFNLERLATDIGVKDHVLFAGAVRQSAVAQYTRCADVFLAVADLSNVGNPLLEAMACGLAVVAVDAGDTRDLVRDGETGLLLPAGRPESIASAVASLVHDSTLRHRIAAGAREYAETHFWTWEARLGAEIEEVERLVRKPAASATVAARSAG
jgi:glycosyltransferase involved in cell wall biosynthesis